MKPCVIDASVLIKLYIYDCIYVAAAVAVGGVVLTADRRLVNAMAGHPAGAFVQGL